MGCWNATCGLTNLPIHSGEEIVVFILRQQDYSTFGESYHYNDGYAPVCLPINAQYNDYGSFENIQNEEIVLDDIRRFKFYSSLESSEDNIVEINNIEDFTDYWQDLFINFREKIYPLTLWMCHKGAYDILLKLFSRRNVYNTTYDLYERNKRIVEDVLNEAKDKFDLIKRMKSEGSYSEDAIKSLDNLNRAILKSSIAHYDLSEHYFYEMVNDGNKNHLDAIIKYLCFCYLLNILRKGFYVQTGHGS